MVRSRHGSSTTPLLSVIIAAYNDWTLLDGCLRSLASEKEPEFEVIVVDDGSDDPAPEYIRHWIASYPLTILRETHQGVSSARNRGIHASKAPLLLFVDADCRVQAGCLAKLVSAVAAAPQCNFFQLRLVGDLSTLTGRAEELRLRTLQQYMLQPNRTIRYLNTAGFAVRPATLDPHMYLFDPGAVRGEDTLLLASLIERGELPLFVSEGSVQHVVPPSLRQYLRKSIRSAYLESGTYRLIASNSVRIRISNRERLRLLLAMWEVAGGDSIGRSAWLVLVIRQSLQRVVSLICWLFRTRNRPSPVVEK